jgi:hypothetical protein
MTIWALTSRGCRETVELYLVERDAQAAVRDCLRDEAGFESLLAVVPLDWDVSAPLSLS